MLKIGDCSISAGVLIVKVVWFSHAVAEVLGTEKCINRDILEKSELTGTLQ